MTDFDRIELRREHNESLAYEAWLEKYGREDELDPEDPGASTPPRRKTTTPSLGDAPGAENAAHKQDGEESKAHERAAT